MKLIVTERFRGVPDGAVYPVWFEVGEPVDGLLGVVAESQGWASEPKTEAPPVKARRKAARA